MLMFTPEQREQLRQEFVSSAQNDPRITGAAHTGSAASGLMDRWSDIDIALCLDPAADANEVLADWTKRFYNEFDAATHHDLRWGNTVFRVFLLKNTLQVDLAFWPQSEFRAMGPTFKLIFGTAHAAVPAPAPAANDLIGMAWLYALHTRSSIARGHLWQAEYMLSAMRDQVLSLACLRNELPAIQGRGFDDLPDDVLETAAACLLRSLCQDELKRAFATTVSQALYEIGLIDPTLANALTNPLDTLVESLG